MATTFASLRLAGLTDEQKLELVGQSWDDLVSSVPPGGLLTDALRDELRRRRADAVARPDDWVVWEDARATSILRVEEGTEEYPGRRVSE